VCVCHGGRQGARGVIPACARASQSITALSGLRPSATKRTDHICIPTRSCPCVYAHVCLFVYVCSCAYSRIRVGPDIFGIFVTSRRTTSWQFPRRAATPCGRTWPQAGWPAPSSRWLLAACLACHSRWAVPSPLVLRVSGAGGVLHVDGARDDVPCGWRQGFCVVRA